MLNHFSGVMAGLVPAIHVLLPKRSKKDMDARDKRGHDCRQGGIIANSSGQASNHGWLLLIAR